MSEYEHFAFSRQHYAHGCTMKHLSVYWLYVQYKCALNDDPFASNSNQLTAQTDLWCFSALCWWKLYIDCFISCPWFTEHSILRQPQTVQCIVYNSFLLSFSVINVVLMQAWNTWDQHFDKTVFNSGFKEIQMMASMLWFVHFSTVEFWRLHIYCWLCWQYIAMWVSERLCWTHCSVR